MSLRLCLCWALSLSLLFQRILSQRRPFSFLLFPSGEPLRPHHQDRFSEVRSGLRLPECIFPHQCISVPDQVSAGGLLLRLHLHRRPALTLPPPKVPWLPHHRDQLSEVRSESRLPVCIFRRQYFSEPGQVCPDGPFQQLLHLRWLF